DPVEQAYSDEVAPESEAAVGDHAISTSEKSGYHIFNRTPSDQTRPLSSDRPAKTVTPYTVDAGHIQVEASGINYIMDEYSQSGVTTELTESSFGYVNAKIGLLNDVDFEFIFS